MKTDRNVTVEVPECPDASVEIEKQIRQAVDEVISFISTDTDDLKLVDFERSLWSLVGRQFQLCVALFLAVRHQRIDVSEYTGNGWRVKDKFAQRTIKTMGGPVRYGTADPI